MTVRFGLGFGAFLKASLYFARQSQKHQSVEVFEGIFLVLPSKDDLSLRSRLN